MDPNRQEDGTAEEVARLREKVTVLEETLRERDRTFGAVLDNLPGFVYRCRNDRDWTMEYVSDRCVAVTGYRPEDLAGNAAVSYNNLILPEYREPIWESWQELLASGSPFERQYPIRAAGGEIRWMWERGRGVFDAGGRLMFLDGYIEDITELRRAQGAQRESQALVRSIGNNLPGGMLYQIIRDTQGNRRITYVSEGVRRLYGCTPEEALADSGKIYGRVAEEDRRRLWEEEERAFRSMSNFSTLARMENPDGGFRWSCFASSPRLLEDGTTSWDGVELDVTERMRAEEKLQESERRFRATFEMAGILMTVIGTDGRVQRINDHFLKTLGLEQEEILGLTSQDVTHPADWSLTERTLTDVLCGKSRGGRIEKRYLRKDGEAVWVDLSIAPLVDGEGKVTALVGAGMDITERKRVEEALRGALEERETLLRELYHRTKNNMQVIMALIDRQASSASDDSLREALGEMKGRIAAMALVHQMLYQGKNLSRVNLGEYVRTLAGLLVESQSPLPHRIRLSLDAGEVHVPLDAAIPCGLVLNELVTNAIKHAFPGARGGEIRVRLRGGEDGEVHLEVSDDGVGLPHGFDVEKVQTMGLWTVNLLVRQLGGDASFAGEGGVTCAIRFPADLYGERV